MRNRRGRDNTGRCWAGLRAGGRWGAGAAAGIETLLLRFPRGCAVIRRTPLARTLLLMERSAPEWATQVATACVAGIGQESNSAVNALCCEAAQARMGLQYRVQGRLILPDKRVSPIVLVPIGAKREKLLDADGKKARLSVTIWIDLCTPSSYLLDAKAARGRARIFVALQARIRSRHRHKRSTTGYPLRRSRLPIPFPLTTPHWLTSLLERRKPTLLLSK